MVIMGSDWLSPKGPSEDGKGAGTLSNKLLWFFGLCLAGVMIVSLAAYLLRALLFL
jgi:hypothetical protein